MGNQHPTITPYETYRCQDGYINLACGNDGMWRAFCKAAGRESWANDERFRTNADRVQNRRALSSLMEPVMLEKTTQEWIELLRDAGIPCGKIQSVGEICEDPKSSLATWSSRSSTPRPARCASPVFRSSCPTTPGAVTLPPPLLGEHTAQVLTEWLQMSAAEVDRLQQAGAL